MISQRSRQRAPAVGNKSTKCLGKANVEVSLAELRELETMDEEDAKPLAVERVREFFKDSVGSVLRAWAHVFDSNNDQRISREEFKNGMRKLNFHGELAAMKLFNLLDKERFNRKKAAKIKSKQWFALRSRQGLNPLTIAKCFEEFKMTLRKKHGNLIRAWRQELTANDAMSMLGGDESGTASLDELDPVGAENLAHFKVWVDAEFGGIRNAFKKMDEDNTKTITVKALELNDANGKLEMDDLIFLEKWQPLEFLLVTPDHKAKEEFKELLLAKMTRYLKGWKRVLDKDNTNRCNWYEFQEACRILGFRGNIGGAWRAFDEDLSGYISLKELDENASKVLLGFRRWAIAEFGSVRQLFTTFDKDKSNSLSFLEWRGALKLKGYDGPSRELFQALDVGGEGSLSVKEVDFLDDWTLDLEEDVSNVNEPPSTPQPVSPRPSWSNERRVSFARRASVTGGVPWSLNGSGHVKSRAVKLLEKSLDRSMFTGSPPSPSPAVESSSSSSEDETEVFLAQRWRTKAPMELAKKVLPKKQPRFYMMNGSVTERQAADISSAMEEMQNTRTSALTFSLDTATSALNFSLETADDSLADQGGSRQYLAQVLDLEQLVELGPRATTAPAKLRTASGARLRLKATLHLRPNAVAYNAALGACGRASSAESALQLLKRMDQLQIQRTKRTYGAAIGACGRGRRSSRGADDVAHAGTVSACARAVAWRQALELLRPEVSDWLDAIATPAFTVAVAACDRASLWQEALAVFMESWLESSMEL
eukprot:g25670.t1